MMTWHSEPPLGALSGLAAGLALLAPGAVRADPAGPPSPVRYQIQISAPSPYISLNNQGQVALNVAFDGVTTLVLLTPTAP